MTSTAPSSDQEPDRQDQDFGTSAAEDQETVDELAAEGVTEEELPGEPDKHPRAGAKAEPAEQNGETE